MDQLNKYLHLYLGCNTNKGTLIGIRKHMLFTETWGEQIHEYDIRNVGKTVFLYLRQLSDLTEEQSQQLNKKGLAIGRPYGYTFTNHGFIYLLSISVDLFGLINSGFAIDVKSITKEEN